MGRLIAGIAAGMLLALGGPLANAAEIKLISSVGVRGVMETLVPAFEKSSGVKVNVVFGSAAALKAKIDGGETFDVAVQVGDSGGGGARLSTACGLALRSGAVVRRVSHGERIRNPAALRGEGGFAIRKCRVCHLPANGGCYPTRVSPDYLEKGSGLAPNTRGDLVPER